MLGIITGFIDELRGAGVPVSMVEAIDGMRAVEAIEIGDRIALRETLRATLIKNLRHESAFDTAFDVYFATVPQQLPEPNGHGEHPAQSHGDRPDLNEPPRFDLDRLLESLLEALAGLDDEAIRVAPAPPSTSWPGWSRAARSEVPTTCTGRCVDSTWPIWRRD